MEAKVFVETLDQLLHRDQLKEAGEYLVSSLAEARACGSWQLEITILNEMMGYYRNVRDEEAGLSAVRDGLRLLEEHAMQETVTAGTTWVNGATTLKAFGRPEEALPYYESAFRVYGQLLDPSDYRFAGLLNNMALTYVDLGEFDMAEAYYGKAMKIMEKLPGGGMELAVTWVNLACLWNARAQAAGAGNAEAGNAEGSGASCPGDLSEAKISDCLDRAWAYFEDPEAVRDSYYAFNCRKCAGTFGYFGRFREKRELERRAEEIYAGA